MHIQTLLKLIILALLITSNQVFAIEFKKEKGIWIKNFFKDQKFVPIEYPMDANKAEKAFKRQILKDFINQNNIAHIEPIAIGASIDDPAIAKFNTACPDKNLLIFIVCGLVALLNHLLLIYINVKKYQNLSLQSF